MTYLVAFLLKKKIGIFFFLHNFIFFFRRQFAIGLQLQKNLLWSQKYTFTSGLQHLALVSLGVEQDIDVGDLLGATRQRTLNGSKIKVKTTLFQKIINYVYNVISKQ